MIIKNIIYGKSFEMMGYWEKISLEMEVQEGEKAEKVLDEAKYIVDTWHKENPSPYSRSAVAHAGNNSVINKADERMEVLIDDCKTLEELATYKSKLTDATRKFYMNKFSQLTKNITV